MGVAGASRPRLGRSDDHRRRPGRLRRRHPDHAAAEPRSDGCGRTRARTRPSQSSATIGFPVDANRLRGQLDRMHRGAALQFRRHRDEEPAGQLDRASGGAVRERRLRACACTSTAARTPAASTGSATSASRGRPSATRRVGATRPTTCSSAARSGRTPPSGGPSSAAFPTEELDEMVAGLIVGWLDRRRGSESFRSFCDRHTDDELGVLIGREPARSRRGVETAEEAA